MDQAFCHGNHPHQDQHPFSRNQRPVIIQVQLNGRGNALPGLDAVGHSPHGLISNRGAHTAVKRPLRIPHPCFRFPSKQYLLPLFIIFQWLQTQQVAHRLRCCLMQLRKALSDLLDHSHHSFANMIPMRTTECNKKFLLSP